MILAGTPIAFHYLHCLVPEWWRFMRMKSSPRHQGAKFNFLYFSYAPDFEFLLISMKSLRSAIPSDLIASIILVVDQKAPFSEEQINQLRGVFDNLKVVPVFNFEWGSPQSTFEEIRIFLDVVRDFDGESDFLVKVDSDIIFLPSEKWRRLHDATPAAFADGHFLQHRFAQGGLYMLRRYLIESAFPDISVTDIENIAHTIDSVGEDMAISHVLEQRGTPFFFSRMMLFPDEYRRIPSFEGLVTREFIALHCHKDKHSMPMLVEKFGVRMD